MTASKLVPTIYEIELEGIVDIRTQELKASNDALKLTQSTLEKTIEQRTDELKQKNEYLSALHETSLGMFTRLDLSQVLESIIKRASSLTRIPDGFVLIYNPGKGVLEIIAACGKYSQLKGTLLFPEEGISGKVWESGEPIMVDDYQAWPGKSKNPCFDFVTSALGVPLTSGSRVEGTIGLSHHDKSKRIDPKNISILDQFAELATIAIDNSKLFESMKKELEKRITLENERTIMEARLRQSQKMEAIGTLAGGIAHDFNNILFPILGFSEMVMHDLPEKSPARHQLQSVLDSALRAKDLVQQILTFSRQSEQDYRPLKIQLIIKEVLKFARASLPSTIKIVADIPRDIGMVMADPTQIHQVAMSLITNALHSMEENGGELFVTLEETMITKENLPDPEMVSGHYVCLSIADTGSGMDQETIKRVFEPYFTTKVRGKGTGLGLAVVHGIVKNLSGEIIVHSGVGKGSKFLVYLPTIIKKDEDIDMKTLSTPQLNGNERILVVDDEKSVLNIIETILSRFGYKVRSHNISIDALKSFKNAPSEFDLVITDMTMPGLTGDQLVAEIKNLRPEIPVILCTGFSEKIADGRAGDVKPDKILIKPVGMDDLLKNVRYLLDN